jgi:hypothetical protein
MNYFHSKTNIINTIDLNSLLLFLNGLFEKSFKKKTVIQIPTLNSN